MRAIEEDASSPLCDDLLHGLQGKRKERHRGAQCNDPGSDKGSQFAEEVEIDFQFNRVKRDVHDLQTTHACWSVVTIAGVAAKGLREAHNDIARFAERRVDG